MVTSTVDKLSIHFHSSISTAKPLRFLVVTVHKIIVLMVCILYFYKSKDGVCIPTLLGQNSGSLSNMLLALDPIVISDKRTEKYLSIEFELKTSTFS